MAISPVSPITGGAQTGFTDPTYTFVSDMAPTANGKQIAVTAVGGTQVGVTTHSASSPFTINFVRPTKLASLQAVSGMNKPLSSVPLNRYKIIVRKGVTVLAGQPIQVMPIEVSLGIPAGADVADPANVRAAISAVIGYLNQLSADLGDTSVTGTV